MLVLGIKTRTFGIVGLTDLSRSKQRWSGEIQRQILVEVII